MYQIDDNLPVDAFSITQIFVLGLTDKITCLFVSGSVSIHQNAQFMRAGIVGLLCSQCVPGSLSCAIQCAAQGAHLSYLILTLSVYSVKQETKHHTANKGQSQDFPSFPPDTTSDSHSPVERSRGKKITPVDSHYTVCVCQDTSGWAYNFSSSSPGQTSYTEVVFSLNVHLSF